MERLQWLMGLMETLKANPILSGFLGASVVGSVLAFAKEVPKRIWNLLVYHTTVTMTINNNENEFSEIEAWLATLDSVLPIRSYRPIKRGWGLAPGVGQHWYWPKGYWPFRVGRSMQDATHTTEKSESIFITTFGKSKTRLFGMMQASHDLAYKNSQDKLRIFQWSGGHWAVTKVKNRRSMSTVYLPEAIKQKLIEDTIRFTNGQEWYASRGIPWRRGYMLFGPPGTGKTTIVQALAGHTKKDLAVLDLNSIQGDSGLIQAFNGLNPGTIVVIEDVDCVSATGSREPKRNPFAEPTEKELDPDDEDGVFDGDAPVAPAGKLLGVTLGGLLNAIDGISSGEGYQLFLTTNHPEKLDPALIREGRVDVKIEIGYMTIEMVEAMAKNFFPDDLVKQALMVEDARSGEPRTPAYWQERMMQASVDKWEASAALPIRKTDLEEAS